jgi:pyruvate formate lyase activating enzyme
MKDIHIADFVPVSLIDYPGLISSVVFTHGCNLLCRYCHNPDLVNRKAGASRLDDFMNGLTGKDIEGVAVTGGEPLVSDGLMPFLSGLKEEGVKVKLDTNGSLPLKLRKVCEAGLVDLVAVDIKAFSDDDMAFITRTGYKLEKLYETLDILREHNVPFELRHTLWKVPSEADVEHVMNRVGDADLIIQFPVKNGRWLDKRFRIELEMNDAEQVIDIFSRYGAKFRNLNE